ncbi:MBL fold metallo-hydrolase [Moraxella sp. ZY210820]|uniref:MBL fold metallo-hydrolase n=1 Tax=unclassified Moraxella TaxID=2685852 RepID=UPI00273151B5|nr:MBL fold metallo-hydrolase [Moraxella sp. ZY210820]WLF84259.1 MBL fold metallo-hydrolase [Moraxella sp. ZY210820]
MLKVQIVPVTPFAQNCSIIWDDESLEAVIVDAGGEANKLQQIVQQLGLKVVALWNTHAHIDHIGAVGELARIWQIPVIGPHRDDEFWVEMLADVAQKYGFAIPEPVQVTQWLNGGDVVKLGQHTFEVRFAPGHTPGHVMFYNDEHKILWAGDVLFKGSIGRTDFPKSNHQQLLDSIQRECLSLDDDVQFIAGHGEMSTIGYERKYNPFLK